MMPKTISLNGSWSFTCSFADERNPETDCPDASIFDCQMPVPGYWDDVIPSLRESSFWSRARFNPQHRPLEYPLGDMPPDASTPFLHGVGWYRRQITVPEGAETVKLRIGGVKLEAWVWIDGECIHHHLGHSTGFEVDLSGQIEAGSEAEIILAVSNLRTDRLGCVIRGWKGFSAGITGDVSLHLAAASHLQDLYVHPSADCTSMHWQIQCAGAEPENCRLAWRIVDRATESEIARGEETAQAGENKWTTSAKSLKPWSDHEANLYRLEVELQRNDKVLDACESPFGLRRLIRDGNNLRLNGRIVFLRGATEHGYYPESCTPPLDKASFRKAISEQQKVGFNWMRFHTSVPSEEYMNAADELGMMFQVEGPVDFTAAEWIDILKACRRHPSVVIYCCGNEECLDDERIEYFAEMARLQKELAPDALFNPHEALRGIEYCWKQSDYGDRVVRKPYPHVPHRLERLKEFSDCIGQYAWGQLSYGCVSANIAQLDERMVPYERPLLSHENGIVGNYLDLALEPRYQKTRIGTAMFASTRELLEKEGILDRASLYYRNSCSWAGAIRRHNMELARRCKFVKGYDHLGGIDCHWHRVGYPCGVLNEFYELKPGDTVDRWLASNGENILLCDYDGSRNLKAGEQTKVPIVASLYRAEPLENATFRWALLAGDNVVQRGEEAIAEVPTGGNSALATLPLTPPAANKPQSLRLRCQLSSPSCEIANEWSFWSFPENETKASQALVVEDLDDKTTEALLAGAAVVLLGNGPFDQLPISFQPSVAGRAKGNLATVIADHPLMRDFPHEGWADWQFAPLMKGANAVVFNKLPLPFEPILEVVSSFKLIRKQAALFEFRVGKGRLLVCTLSLPAADAGARWLKNQLVAYAEGAFFTPEHEIPKTLFTALFGRESQTEDTLSTDQGFDLNARVRR